MITLHHITFSVISLHDFFHHKLNKLHNFFHSFILLTEKKCWKCYASGNCHAIYPDVQGVHKVSLQFKKIITK